MSCNVGCTTLISHNSAKLIASDTSTKYSMYSNIMLVLKAWTAHRIAEMPQDRGWKDRYIRRNQVRSGDAKMVADFRVTEWFSLNKQSNNKLLTNKIFLLCCYWWLHLIFMQSSGIHSFLLGDLWARFAHAYHTLSARKMAAINDESFIHWILSLLMLEYWHN